MISGQFGVTRVNSFKVDLEFSLNSDADEEINKWYHTKFDNLERIEFVHDLAIQKTGIDKVLHMKDGTAIKIEEKRRRNNYPDILLEIWSDYERRKSGWLFTSQSDYLVYIMPKKVYMYDFRLLRNAWRHYGKAEWFTDYRKIVVPNKSWTTVNIPIPVKVLESAIFEEIATDIISNN